MRPLMGTCDPRATKATGHGRRVAAGSRPVSESAVCLASGMPVAPAVVSALGWHWVVRTSVGSGLPARRFAARERVAVIPRHYSLTHRPEPAWGMPVASAVGGGLPVRACGLALAGWCARQWVVACQRAKFAASRCHTTALPPRLRPTHRAGPAPGMPVASAVGGGRTGLALGGAHVSG